jgi:hypothetical protein
MLVLTMFLAMIVVGMLGMVLVHRLFPSSLANGYVFSISERNSGFRLSSPLPVSASDHLQAREVGARARHRLHGFANASLVAIAGDYLRKARILGMAYEYQLCFRRSHRAPCTKSQQRRKRVAAKWTGDGGPGHRYTDHRDSYEFV